MYKVFLVDDEIVVREGIRDNVNWDSTNFTLVGEAPDGEMALPLIQELKPDILLTDIKMPFMDGLKLSRIVKKIMPWIKIIILSGHDEFNFAKEAITIGVTEYLLKPLGSSDLIKSLNEVAAQIESEKEERESIEKLKNQLEGNSELLKEKFLNRLSLGLIQADEAFEKCSRFNINLIGKYYIVEVIEPLAKENIISNSLYSQIMKIDSIILSIVDNNHDILRFKRSMEETILILKGETVLSLEESAYSFAQSIKYEVERNTECFLTIGIGSVRERIQGISQSFYDADTAKNYKYIFGKSKIIGIKDINIDIENKNNIFTFDKLSINEYLRSGYKSNIKEYLKEYIRYMDEPNLKSFIFISYSFIEIVIASSRFVEELGGNIKDLVPELDKIENILMKLDSINSFKEYAEKILIKVFDFRDSRIDKRYGSIISKVKEHINVNYADHEISLNAVAAYANMSPSHFSTIFSQETGGTFIEYLIRTRIKKAKELLKTTNNRSSEIAYAVGYNDPHYFSYIFKKYTGLTPKEYRNEGLK